MVLLGEVCDLGVSRRQQPVRSQPNRLVVRSRLEHNERAVQDPLVDENAVIETAERRNRPQLELLVCPDKVFLARELDPGCVEGKSSLLEVEPIEGAEGLRGRTRTAS
jgi:hypothetical protein